MSVRVFEGLDLHVFEPNLLLEIELSESALRSRILQDWPAQLSSELSVGWMIHGPLRVSEQRTVAYFKVPFGKHGQPIASILEAFDRIDRSNQLTLRAPEVDPDLDALRVAESCVNLRLFSRPEDGDTSALRIWMRRASEILDSEFGRPSSISIGDYRSLLAGTLEETIEVACALGFDGGIPVSLVWKLSPGVALLVGSTGVDGCVQLALVGGMDVSDLGIRATWIRSVALDLVSVIPPLFARIAIEGTGLSAFDTYSRPQPGAASSPGTSWTERHLSEWVPDAYWWQIIDRDIASRLPPGIEVTSVAPSSVSIQFGAAQDWCTDLLNWNDYAASPRVAVSAIRGRARERLQSLMKGRPSR